MGNQLRAKLVHQQGSSDGDSTEMEWSQHSFDSQQLVKMLDQIKQRDRDRRMKRKEAIVADHKARIDKMHSAIEKCFRDHEKKVRLQRSTKLQHLAGLLQKERKLLFEIEKIEASLHAATASAAKSLEIALVGRIDDLGET